MFQEFPVAMAGKLLRMGEIRRSRGAFAIPCLLACRVPLRAVGHCHAHDRDMAVGWRLCG